MIVMQRISSSNGCAMVAGLVDDTFGIELLIGATIVSLSLPVLLVWECVWRHKITNATS